MLARRGIGCEHWWWAIDLSMLLEVRVRVRRLWSLLHGLLLKVHYLAGTGWNDGHWQPMWVLWVCREVAMLLVVWARLRLVVEEG